MYNNKSATGQPIRSGHCAEQRRGELRLPCRTSGLSAPRTARPQTSVSSLFTSPTDRERRALAFALDALPRKQKTDFRAC